MNFETFLVISLLFGLGSSQLDRLNLKFYRHPDSFLSQSQIIRKYGYPVELHKVVTEDGHIVGVHRVPYGRARPQTRANRSAVLILHGMGGTTDHFTVLGPGRGLPYYLADHGFDVWLMNARGGRYSSGHVRYDWDVHQQFWNFSWHHIGYYDISATVDYVIKNTDQKKVFFIGHSSGGTSYIAASSDRPELSDKIKMAAGLATSVFMQYIDAPLMTTSARGVTLAQAIMDVLGFEEPPGGSRLNRLINTVVKMICSETSILAKMCIGVMNVIASHDSVIFDEGLITLVITSMPARVSAKQSFHFAQLVNSGRFCKYDYGPRGNRALYGTEDPPDYNLSNSRAPVALFYGRRDFLAHPRGVLHLASKLPNLVVAEEVPLPDFNHLDFLFGKNTTELVYSRILELFKNYDRGIVPRVTIDKF